MKKLAILGSTGSIGNQALDVVRKNNEYKIIGLTANENIEVLEKQALEFRPKIVSISNSEKAKILKDKLSPYNIKVVSGINGMIEVATSEEVDIVLTSVVGMVGLTPTLHAIEAGKTIALANKETLVTGGQLVMKKAKEKAVNIIPVDSEHSAIFQCLQAGKQSEVSKLILTASGGPFRGKKREEIEKMGSKEALKHPNWSMGKKITIDSATLMNKGLEVIEAKWLFDIDVNNIDVVIHPQSIVHSMVEFVDGSIIAQLGTTDMRIPIQYALTYPDRKSNDIPKLDLVKIGQLTFDEPDLETFPCLKLAVNAIDVGGTMPTVLNAANEVAVSLFLGDKIGFYDISDIIWETMELHKNKQNPSLEEILEADNWARSFVLAKYQ